MICANILVKSSIAKAQQRRTGADAPNMIVFVGRFLLALHHSGEIAFTITFLFG
jgi:hypothetical protein